MIEITYQMVLSTLQTIALIVGIYYYVMVLRNQQRSRKTQMFMPIYSRVLDSEYRRHFSDIRVWEWEDFDDWEKKYYENRDEWAKLVNVVMVLEWVSVLLKRKDIDFDIVYDTLRIEVTRLWDGIGPIIKEGRVRWDFPEFGAGVETLYNELKKHEK